MRRRLSAFQVTIVGCILVLVAAVAARAAEPRTPLAKIELDDGQCLVFLGDSITHQCLYTQYVEDYFYTRMPHKRPRFHNAGVGGDSGVGCTRAL